MCCRSRRVLGSRKLWSNRIKKYHAQEILEEVTPGDENIGSSEVGHIYDDDYNDKSNIDVSCIFNHHSKAKLLASVQFFIMVGDFIFHQGSVMDIFEK